MLITEGPSELANKVLENYSVLAGFPSPDTVRRIVHRVFQMSLTLDEGRYPRLLFVHPASESVDSTFVPLGKNPLYLPDLVSLAQAIPPPPFAVVLRGEAVRCHGVIRLDPERPHGAYFGIRGPGEIEITIHDGQPHSWLLTKGSCSCLRRLRDSVIFGRLCEAAAAATQRSTEAVLGLLAAMVHSIARRDHGGSLLFLDGEIRDASGMRIDFGDDNPLPLLNESQASIACSLSQIDGAMLFDCRLRLRGAGLFLSHQAVKVVPVGGHEAVDIHEMGLGTRHRSAASFCSKHAGATAVVISQDRNIRIFGSRADGGVEFEGPFVDSMIDQ